jgi:DNA-binding PucR family transcriptional regulator
LPRPGSAGKRSSTTRGCCSPRTPRPPAPSSQRQPTSCALIAIAARSGRRGRVRAEEFLPELLLAGAPAIAGRIAARVFGPLDRADAADLAATLRTLAASGFDATAAAAALPVHRNTLLYRVARIGKLTSLSLKDQRDRTLVLLAVTWEAIAGGVRPAAGEPGDPGF